LEFHTSVQKFFGIFGHFRLSRNPRFRWVKAAEVSGDTELFGKVGNLNGFLSGRAANSLYISLIRAAVFQTAALFLHPNSSVVIAAENPGFLPVRRKNQ